MNHWREVLYDSSSRHNKRFISFFNSEPYEQKGRENECGSPLDSTEIERTSTREHTNRREWLEKERNGEKREQVCTWTLPFHSS